MPSVPDSIGSAQHAWWVCDDLDAAWSALRAHTTDVPAAGGLLTNDQGELLCIHRLGHWDLPKGKLEPGEILEEAAAREVQEECGCRCRWCSPLCHHLPRVRSRRRV